MIAAAFKVRITATTINSNVNRGTVNDFELTLVFYLVGMIELPLHTYANNSWTASRISLRLKGLKKVR